MKSEEYRFYALVSRMRYITRWGLMRNTFSENVQEHSHMVAVLAHGLALIQRDILHDPSAPDPDRCAAAALFQPFTEAPLSWEIPLPADLRELVPGEEKFSALKEFARKN